MSSSRRVLVTGASGFIGGAIVRRLRKEGVQVAALLRDPASYEGPAEVHIEAGSILDPNAIAFAAKRADVIIHAAGIADPRAGERALRWTLVAGTENVVRAARHADVPRVVVISCADVTLSNQNRVHWDEKRDLVDPPVGHRAQALRLAEEIALSVSDAKVEVVALRPGWVWGPGDISRLPALIREAKTRGIAMYGDGRNLIATTYIETLCESVLAASRAPSVGGQAYHIGDPEFMEAREFFGALSTALGLPKPRKGPSASWALPLARLRGTHARHLPEEIILRSRSALFDVQKAIAQLDFRATITLSEGMAALRAWVDSMGGIETLLRTPPTIFGDDEFDSVDSRRP